MGFEHINHPTISVGRKIPSVRIMDEGRLSQNESMIMSRRRIPAVPSSSLLT